MSLLFRTHEEFEIFCGQLFHLACDRLKIRGLSFKIMTGRQKPVKSINNITLGYTSLKTGAVTIDVYTPKNRKPKSFASILRTIAHEIAHHQKKPYRQFYRGRWIIRKHYPAFYHRVNKNITQLKKDVILGQYFNTP